MINLKQYNNVLVRIMKIVKYYKPNQKLILFFAYINIADFPAEKNNNKNSKSKHAVKYDLI